MHRFLVPPELIQGKEVAFPKPEWRHLNQVLRLQPGDEVIVFDGQGKSYLTSITETGGLIQSILPSTTEPQIRIHLAQGLAKGEKMEIVIQKAVELGVYQLIPLATEHAVVRLDPQDVKKQERWQRIAEEACKQCGRDRVPLVSQVHKFDQILSGWQHQSVCFFYEAARTTDDRSLKSQLAQIKAEAPTDLLLVVGPEGGFSKAEASKAQAAGWKTCSLGPRILRTETAAITALSIIMYELADLG